MADGVCNSLPNEMLRVQMQAARYHHVGRLGGEFAKHVPLLRKPFGQSPQILGELVETDLWSTAQRSDEGSQLALLLKHQLFQMIELRLEVPPRRLVPLERFKPERGAGEKLDDTVVQVARKR